MVYYGVRSITLFEFMLHHGVRSITLSGVMIFFLSIYVADDMLTEEVCSTTDSVIQHTS